MRVAAALLAAMLAACASAAPDSLVPVTGEYTPTSPAYTYILDRGPVLTDQGAVDQASIDLLADGPPKLLESGNIWIVAIEDACEQRAHDIAREYGPVR